MSILVTGSAGRLGRALSVELSRRGHAVIGVDRTTAELPGVDQLVCDLADAAAVAAVLREHQPEAIVHLAAIAVPFSAPEAEILATNTGLAQTVLAAAAASNVTRVLLATSPTPVGYSSPTWRPVSLPIDEDHPLSPTNAYALSKLVMEEQARMFARSSDLVVGCFRPCYVIAPEEWEGAPTQQGHTVAERLADPSLAAVSLFNYVDARDVGAFVDAWLAADAERVNGEVFFVGAADALAIAPVAEIWRAHAPHLGPDADLLTGTAPVFSTDKATRLLGWRPQVRWRDAVADPHIPKDPPPIDREVRA